MNYPLCTDRCPDRIRGTLIACSKCPERQARVLVVTRDVRIIPMNSWMRKHYRVVMGYRADWRESFEELARVAWDGVPFAAATVEVQPRLKFRRKMDCEAPVHCAKSALDGIVDAGVLPDDKPPYVRWIRYWPPILGCEQDSLTLTLTEVVDP